MLNRLAIQYKLQRLVTQAKSLHEVSDRQWELSPGETTYAPPAIYLDGMLDRVTGVAHGTTQPFELARITGGKREHRATTAYSLGSATLVDGYIYRSGMKYSLTPQSEPLWVKEPCEELSQAALACSWCGNRFFGDWMLVDLPLGILARQLAEPIVVPKPLFRHEGEYRNLLDIQARSVKHARIHELMIVDDVGQNSLKRERYEKLRSQFQTAVHEANRVKPTGVFIRRGASSENSRRLSNQEEIENFCLTLGFDILDQENLSAEAITRSVQGADIIMGVEGSHMAHGVFGLDSRGAILILQPPERFCNVYKDYTDCMGSMSYGFVVGEPTSEGFHIKLDELAKTLEKLQAA